MTNREQKQLTQTAIAEIELTLTKLAQTLHAARLTLRNKDSEHGILTNTIALSNAQRYLKSATTCLKGIS